MGREADHLGPISLFHPLLGRRPHSLSFSARVGHIQNRSSRSRLLGLKKISASPAILEKNLLNKQLRSGSARRSPPLRPETLQGKRLGVSQPQPDPGRVQLTWSRSVTRWRESNRSAVRARPVGLVIDVTADVILP